MALLNHDSHFDALYGMEEAVIIFRPSSSSSWSSSCAILQFQTFEPVLLLAVQVSSRFTLEDVDYLPMYVRKVGQMDHVVIFKEGIGPWPSFQPHPISTAP